MHKEETFPGDGGGGGDLKEVWLGLCYKNPSIMILAV